MAHEASGRPLWQEVGSVLSQEANGIFHGNVRNRMHLCSCLYHSPLQLKSLSSPRPSLIYHWSFQSVRSPRKRPPLAGTILKTRRDQENSFYWLVLSKYGKGNPCTFKFSLFTMRNYLVMFFKLKVISSEGKKIKETVPLTFSIKISLYFLRVW